MAAKISEDPGVGSNEGRLGYFPASGKMDPAFSKAAFALARIGDVSEPVKTQYGWQLIRLDGRKAASVRPFEDVKPDILAAMRRQYIQEQQNAILAAIRNDPAIKVNQTALDALTTPVSLPFDQAPGTKKP
ncbi:MAG: peptidylprolyl isomerase [Pseudomonadota bacterium]|nr:peptidylprolyl isomerase [Pseudomonadota bacterium]